MSTFAERLRETRESFGVSQSDLARRCGLEPSAISHFETSTREPSIGNLVKLADALRVDADSLLGRSIGFRLRSPMFDEMWQALHKLPLADAELACGFVHLLLARHIGPPKEAHNP